MQKGGWLKQTNHAWNYWAAPFATYKTSGKRFANPNNNLDMHEHGVRTHAHMHGTPTLSRSSKTANFGSFYIAVVVGYGGFSWYYYMDHQKSW